MDYGLVAFKRSEDSIKQNLKIKYDENFKHNIFKGVTNITMFNIGTIKTSELVSLRFKLICNVDCSCEIYVNDSLEYAANLAGESEFCLKLNGECKIEVKLLTTSNQTITLESNIFGKFIDLKPLNINYFKNNNYHFMVMSNDNSNFEFVTGSSISELMSKFNTSTKNLLLNYVCGASTSSGFYYIINSGNTSYLTGVVPQITLSNYVSFGSVLSYDCTNNNLIVFELDNNKIKVSTLSLNGEISYLKTLSLPNGIYVKNLFPIINNSHENLTTGFIFSDVNSQMYLVLCNINYLSNLSQKPLNCITLSIKGDRACGYVCDGKYFIEINNELGAYEIVMKEVSGSILKQSEKLYINTTNRIILNNANYILNFNGYMVEHNDT